MMAAESATNSGKANMNNKIKNKRKRRKMFNRFFLKILICAVFFLGCAVLFLPELLLLGVMMLFGISFSIIVTSSSPKITPTRKIEKFIFLLFLAGVNYLPSKSYNRSPSELSSRLPFGIGVHADVVLMSTFVEVTKTVPPPAATATAPAAAPAPAPDGNAPAAQATDVATDTAVATAAVATNTAVAASITASGTDSSQPTASGGGQAMAQEPRTTAATSTAAAAATETGTVVAAASPTNSGEVQVSGLAGANTALVSMPAAPSGITTSTIRGKSSPTATSTPSPTSAATSPSSTRKFRTYAAGLASGTTIIAAAGACTAFYLVRRRKRRYRQRRKPSLVNEIGQANNSNNNPRPFSIRKVSDVMSMTSLSHKPFGDSNKLTSMKPPPDIDPETSWPRGYVPPDPGELRERMDDEKRRSGGSGGRGRDGFDSAVDLGIGYVSSAVSAAGAAPGDKRDGYFDGYSHEALQTRPLSEMSMPEHMKHIMTPLQPRHTQDSVPEPVNRFDTVSPSIYSRRDSIVTSFGEIHAKIDGTNNFNAHREEYRLRKEQARQQFGTYDYVEEEEESPDEWAKQDRPLEESERLKASRLEEYNSPYTAQHSTPSLLTGAIGHHGDYFSAQHSSSMNPDNRECQYEDIDLSQNDPYAEETTNSNKGNSGGYFGRFFGRGSGR